MKIIRYHWAICIRRSVLSNVHNNNAFYTVFCWDRYEDHVLGGERWKTDDTKNSDSNFTSLQSWQRASLVNFSDFLALQVNTEWNLWNLANFLLLTNEKITVYLIFPGERRSSQRLGIISQMDGERERISYSFTAYSFRANFSKKEKKTVWENTF